MQDTGILSADQFGEQTAIKMGKGSLRGMTLSPELVLEWIGAFPITVHGSEAVDTIYFWITDDLALNTSNQIR